MYTLNRFPTKALKEKISNEAWSGIKPFVNHFKVLGFICYDHITAEKRIKFDEKCQNVYFLVVVM